MPSKSIFNVSTESDRHPRLCLRRDDASVIAVLSILLLDSRTRTDIPSPGLEVLRLEPFDFLGGGEPRVLGIRPRTVCLHRRPRAERTIRLDAGSRLTVSSPSRSAAVNSGFTHALRSCGRRASRDRHPAARRCHLPPLVDGRGCLRRGRSMRQVWEKTDPRWYDPLAPLWTGNHRHGLARDR